MKDFAKSIHVGNIKDDKKAQQLWEEMQHAKKLAEDWAREIHRTGKEEYKGSQKDAEEAYRKAKREYEKYAMNAKTGNALKYTNLEEAKKMCRQINDSLAPDAALRHYRHVYEKDGAYYVMETGEGTAKGMKRVGNDTPAEYFSKKPKVIGNEKTGVEGFFKQLSDDVKDREKKDDKEIEKVGNSASDDKFAYVMREFDEGKLKTPDGKVVTDPAQAKAVAYSESKKTENGLARARNAMNKKVKNSAVREYKHSDGRIAQIDFNEDGSDADMSIYEGTKEIEQRNFSTIRDAEQYVTSHGFRRI